MKLLKVFISEKIEMYKSKRAYRIQRKMANSPNRLSFYIRECEKMRSERVNQTA